VQDSSSIGTGGKKGKQLDFSVADCLISDMGDEMTTRLRQADRDVAAAKSVAVDAVNQCAATSEAVSAAEHGYYHATKACATLKKNAK